MKRTFLGHSIRGVLPAVLVSVCAGGLLAQQTPERPNAARQNAPPDAQSRTNQQRPPTSRNAPPPADTDQAQSARDDMQDKPILGVMLEPSPTTGVLVTAVMPDGPADAAGIREGDYILSIDGQRVNSPDMLSQRISDKKLGDQLQVTIWRDGGRQELNATLAAMPDMDNPGDMPGGSRRNRPRELDDQNAAWIGAWLGKAREGEGVVVRGVYPSGPAARAGLYSGDVIVKINDQSISTPEQAADAIRGLTVTEPAEITVRREDEEITVTLQPGDRQNFAGADIYPPVGDDDGADFDERMDIPDHAMMLEQHRRFAEQHERIEQMIQELTDEVRQLRAELQQTRGQN
jgi:predicted metalloprotease with PDZ domain